MMTYTDYLKHHGILGMKWGQRNGPPYPLDAEDHSAREKKAGWRKSLSNNKEKSSHNAKKRNDLHINQRRSDDLAITIAELEDMKRQLTKKVPKGTDILTTPEMKQKYHDTLESYKRQTQKLLKLGVSYDNSVVGKDKVYVVLKDRQGNTIAETMARLFNEP